MKYVCLGYMDPKKWVTMSEGERNTFIDGCFDYDDELRKNGHFAGGEALQGHESARRSAQGLAQRAGDHIDFAAQAVMLDRAPPARPHHPGAV